MNIEEIFQKANEGDVDAILQLKFFAEQAHKLASIFQKLEKVSQEIFNESQAVLEKFYYDGNKEHAVGTIILREGITEIKDEEFKGCKKLEKVILPESLTYISYCSFYGCSSLKEINLQDCLKLDYIGDSAFYGCSRLTEINFPENLTEIGNWAFCGCISLKEVNLPKGVHCRGSETFFACNSLKKRTYY